MEFNEALHLAIRRSVRTQTRLAAKSGIGEARISRIVNGWAEPSEDEQRKIAKALDRPRAELFEVARV